MGNAVRLVQTSLGAATVIVVLLAPASPTAAQGAASAPPDQDAPTYAVSLGFGNVHGWLGGSVERFLSKGRHSVALGVGRFPASASSGVGSDPWFTAFGAGYRRYLGPPRHRASLELSVTMVGFRRTETVADGVLGVDRNYGPGLAVGYRFTSGMGLHLDVSLGAGWAVDAHDDGVEAIGGLAFGYTWR